MYNQPYEESIENLDHVPGASTVSLTQIIAASMMSPDPNPTAPSQTNLDTAEASFARAASDTALDRPPPFSPAHMEQFDPAPEPSAPSNRTLQRPWPEAPIGKLLKLSKEQGLYNSSTLERHGIRHLYLCYFADSFLNRHSLLVFSQLTTQVSRPASLDQSVCGTVPTTRNQSAVR